MTKKTNKREDNSAFVKTMSEFEDELKNGKIKTRKVTFDIKFEELTETQRKAFYIFMDYIISTRQRQGLFDTLKVCKRVSTFSRQFEKVKKEIYELNRKPYCAVKVEYVNADGESTFVKVSGDGIGMITMSKERVSNRKTGECKSGEYIHFTAMTDIAYLPEELQKYISDKNVKYGFTHVPVPYKDVQYSPIW